MSDASVYRYNPFSSDAVAKFGNITRTSAGLRSLEEIKKEVHRYITDYPDPTKREGAAIGLRGEYGSGKTHVLSWIAKYPEEIRSIRCAYAYAICSTDRLYDLVSQLLHSFSRAQLVELIQLALLNFARDSVQMFKLTEELVARLETIDGLQALQEEGNIDLEQLRQRLQTSLKEAVTYPEMARVLLDIIDPILGDDAYNWLTVGKVSDLARLGVNSHLDASADPVSQAYPMEAEIRVLASLEAVCALHRVAGVPLLILVDQFQVLMCPSVADGTRNMDALAKLLLEQVKGQDALIVIAGTPEVWKTLARDVLPRFKHREQIVLGRLSLSETSSLLRAYADGRAPNAFSPQARDAIYELSGGVPREILRIAYHAFEATKGDLAQCDHDLIVRSAKHAGTVADRADHALACIDQILLEFGKPIAAMNVGGEVIDRVLVTENGMTVAVFVVLKATDGIDEIDSARRLLTIRRHLNGLDNNSALVVISVGYSSREVHALIDTRARLIKYSEKAFENDLRSALLDVMAERSNIAMAHSGRDTSSALPTVAVSPPLQPEFAELAARLDVMERRRNEDLEQVQARFVNEIRELSVTAKREVQLTTRLEVLDALDALLDALLTGSIEAERTIIRSILIANETRLHRPEIDELGELYIDLLSIERFGGETYNTTSRRHDLLGTLRESLRQVSLLDLWLLNYRRCLALFGGLFVCTVLSGYAASMWAERLGMGRRIPALLYLPLPYDPITVLPYVFIAISGLLAAYAYARWSRKNGARRRYQIELWQLRHELNQILRKNPISRKYPQTL